MVSGSRILLQAEDLVGATMEQFKTWKEVLDWAAMSWEETCAWFEMGEMMGYKGPMDSVPRFGLYIRRMGQRVRIAQNKNHIAGSGDFDPFYADSSHLSRFYRKRKSEKSKVK
jgi:hypothetical protein